MGILLGYPSFNFPILFQSTSFEMIRVRQPIW
jgi:hypothetical protein